MSNLDAIYVDVDDFCLLFEPQWQAHLIETGEEQRTKLSRLTYSETLEVQEMELELPKKFEIHYHLDDSSYSMNALIKSKCEAEFITVAVEVADLLEIPFNLDCDALEEGGVREIWKALGDNNAQIALIISVLAFIWSTLPKTDNELIELQKEDTRLSIEERKLTINIVKHRLLILPIHNYKSLIINYCYFIRLLSGFGTI